MRNSGSVGAKMQHTAVPCWNAFQLRLKTTRGIRVAGRRAVGVPLILIISQPSLPGVRRRLGWETNSLLSTANRPPVHPLETAPSAPARRCAAAKSVRRSNQIVAPLHWLFRPPPTHGQFDDSAAKGSRARREIKPRRRRHGGTGFAVFDHQTVNHSLPRRALVETFDPHRVRPADLRRE